MISALILVVWLISCEKETAEPTPKQELCDCYESHYIVAVSFATGTAVTYWKWDYNTSPSPDLCEKETGNFVENGNGHKYKVICN